MWLDSPTKQQKGRILLLYTLGNLAQFHHASVFSWHASKLLSQFLCDPLRPIQVWRLKLPGYEQTRTKKLNYSSLMIGLVASWYCWISSLHIRATPYLAWLKWFLLEDSSIYFFPNIAPEVYHDSIFCLFYQICCGISARNHAANRSYPLSQVPKAEAIVVAC